MENTFLSLAAVLTLEVEPRRVPSTKKEWNKEYLPSSPCLSLLGGGGGGAAGRQHLCNSNRAGKGGGGEETGGERTEIYGMN